MFALRSSGNPLETAAQLKPIVDRVMRVDSLTYGSPEKGYAVRFEGRLHGDSIAAYDEVEAAFRPLEYTPLFRKEQDKHVVLAMPGVVQVRQSNLVVNIALFGLTLVSLLWVGALLGDNPATPETLAESLRFIASGWPYAVSLSAILLAHEFGHYIAARRSGTAVTLPYFIPFPYLPFGTFGAAILLKAPPKNRRVLLDIGISGPLAGLVVAIPVLFYGLYTAHVQPIPATIPQNAAQFFEGNSLAYLAAKFFVFGKLLPAPASFGNLSPFLFWLKYFFTGLPAPTGGEDVIANQALWAGWVGLLVTGLNLIPAGQLDGGHALYVLIGRAANKVLPIVLGVLILLGIGWPPGTGWLTWFLWAVLIFAFGRAHAEPLDQITDLDPGRKTLAIFTLIIFILVFAPVPIRIFFG